MSVTLYDNALADKLNYWIGGSNLQLYTVEETRRLWQINADQNNDQPLKLPLIALARKPGYLINEKTKQPRTYAGVKTAVNESSNITLMTIPITIEYQIDILTRYLDECDSITRNLIFNIINYPSLKIEITYENQKLTHSSNIRLQSDVEDNSDIQERLITGQFTRNTLTINIDDAFLFDVRVRNNSKIVEVVSSTPSNINDQNQADIIEKIYPEEI